MQWFFIFNGETNGPLASSQINTLIEAGKINKDTLVWTQGMNDWSRAEDKFDFWDTSTLPPPIPPSVLHASKPDQETHTRQNPSDQAKLTGPDGLHIYSPSRSFFEAIEVGFLNYVNFSGRASRSEFWYFTLFSLVLQYAVRFADEGASNTIYLILVLPLFSVSWRRLHDINRTGMWALAPLATGLLSFIIMRLYIGDPQNPLIYVSIFMFGAVCLVVLVFYCLRGTPGPNRFG